MKLRIKNALIGAAIGLLASLFVIQDTHAHTVVQDYIDGWIDGYLAGSNNRLKGTVKERRLWWTISQVESNGRLQLPGNKIAIRYEPHIMGRCLKRTNVKWSVRKKLPYSYRSKVSSKNRLENNYTYLAKANELGLGYCGHWSTSYGTYQIMGFHYKLLGFSSPKAMADAYHLAPNKEFNFKMFMRFIKNYKNGTAYRALMEYRFDDFARIYNGCVYNKKKQCTTWRYSNKLRKFYEKSKRKIK